MKNQRRGVKLRQQIKQYIINYTDQHGYPPSLREMAQAVNRSIYVIYYHMERMTRGGDIVAEISDGRRKARSYRVIKPEK